MKKNRLGTSDLFISELGFGCMSLSDDHQTNEKLIHSAIDRGVNYFDTADLYQFGLNEETVGKALKGKRDQIILASKGGNEWGEGIDGWRWNPDKNYLKKAVKNSLSRLQTDYLDLYQLHGGTADDPIDEVIEAFEDLVQEGTVRYYGISSIRPNVIKTFLEKSNIVSVMMQYSLLDRRPEEWFPLFEENKVSVIARGPVAKGLLTDTFERKLGTDGYLDYTEEELLKVLPELKAAAAAENMSLQELALRYVMDQSPVASAVAGASQENQLKENIKSTQVPPLDSNVIDSLRKKVKTSVYDKHR